VEKLSAGTRVSYRMGCIKPSMPMMMRTAAGFLFDSDHTIANLAETRKKRLDNLDSDSADRTSKVSSTDKPLRTLGFLWRLCATLHAGACPKSSIKRAPPTRCMLAFAGNWSVMEPASHGALGNK